MTWVSGSDGATLTEVGVSFVTVYYGGWDNHTNLFKAYKGSFMSKLDQGLPR